MAEGGGFQVRLASGEAIVGRSLWEARHLIAQRVAFDPNPLDPRGVLPAEVWRVDAKVFGGRVYVETISTAAQLSAIE